MLALADVYDSEHNAERATLKGDLAKARSYHETSIELLHNILKEIELNDKTITEENGINESNGKLCLSDEYHVVKSLHILRKQVTRRIEELTLLIKSKESRERQIAHKRQVQEQEQKELESLTKLNGSTVSNSESNPDLKIELSDKKILSHIFNKINNSLIRNLNIDVNDPQLSSKNIKFIDHKRIVELEHQLQLLNFSERSKHDNRDLNKEKNELFSELNLLYYNQIASQSEFIRELMDLMRQPWAKIDAQEESADHEEEPEENSISLKNYKSIVSDLQLKLSSSEREKVLLENQIVKLKERWNNLVESARLRKEQERVNATTS